MGNRMSTLDDLERVERELRASARMSTLAEDHYQARVMNEQADIIAAYIASAKAASQPEAAPAQNSEAVTTGWRPIETAPRDGSWFLVWNGNWVGVAKYREPYDDTDPCPSWEDETGHFITPQPTIWQPRPEPPKENATKGSPNPEGLSNG